MLALLSVLGCQPRECQATRQGRRLVRVAPASVGAVPTLIVRGGAKAIEFYAEVFGATERMRFPGPDDSVAHAEIEIGDSVIIIEDESPRRAPRRPRPAG